MAGLTRRQVLRGAGGIAISLPFLESLDARAGGAGGIVRYLQFMHVQGTLKNEWAPSGPADAMVLSEILSPLEPHKADILVLSGVENPAANDFGVNGHVNPGHTVFTCAHNSGNNNLADGISIDQLIAERLAAPTPYRSLQFGIGGDGVGEYQALYAGPQDPIPLDGDPQAIFTSLFSDLEMDPDLPATTIQRLHARRQSVLDSVVGSFDTLRTRVSAADRVTLDNHADKIRQLEEQLDNEGEAGSGCAVPMLDIPAGYNPYDLNYDVNSSRLMIDLMVMALACDLTRVGTLQYTRYHDPVYPWLDLGIPLGYTEWHALVHDIPNMQDLTVPRRVYRWYMEELNYLVDQLALMPDQDGTLLDNMLLFSTAEMADPDHSNDRMPLVLAGRLGGALTTGRHLNLTGTRLGEVYAGFLNLFGGTDQTFGAPEYCDGPVGFS